MQINNTGAKISEKDLLPYNALFFISSKPWELSL